MNQKKRRPRLCEPGPLLKTNVMEVFAIQRLQQCKTNKRLT